MRTSLDKAFLASPTGEEAERILRKCVHCGFCNATCPTYQLTGDELDGPRGRIYQIKQVLEGQAPSEKTLQHMDRCLTCRNCETTCPSGVDYARLIDIGRHAIENSGTRSFTDTIKRRLLRQFLLSPLFGLTLASGRIIRPVLPKTLKRKVPERQAVPDSTPAVHDSRILLISGCVQKSLQPSIDAAAVALFDRIGLGTVSATGAGCCGALCHHLSAEQAALAQIRKNIDAWHPMIENGEVEAITMTASGCGVMVRDYQHLLAHDAEYSDRARQVSEAYLDPIEILARYRKEPLAKSQRRRIAFHPPCTLQHGQKITGMVEALLIEAGHELVSFDDSHLCCGSAGTYSITQPELASQLKTRKLNTILQKDPEVIVTANIGCQTHLQSGTDIPVRHWLEML